MADQDNIIFVYRGGNQKRTDVSTVQIQTPPYITSIDDYAFWGWTSLTNITIPPTVTSLQYGTFRSCSSLLSVTLPPTLTSVGDYTFAYCTSLITILLPSTLTSLGRGTFSGCSSLTTVTLPSELTYLQNATFYKCSSLTEVTLPSKLTTIGNDTFGYCSSLVTVDLPPTLTTLGSGTFLRCSSLLKVVIPSTVTSIRGHNCFHDCVSLASVSFRADPRAVSVAAFEGCDTLSVVEAPSFSTDDFHTNPDELPRALVGAGYSPVPPEDVLNHPTTTRGGTHDGVYHDTRTWARTRRPDGRLPLCAAAARRRTWPTVRGIFGANMPALHEGDAVSGLPLFALAAAGPEGGLEPAYRLLREYPPAVSSAGFGGRDGFGAGEEGCFCGAFRCYCCSVTKGLRPS